MIEQFRDIPMATKDEMVRAWSVQAAVEKLSDHMVRRGTVTELAAEIEQFVINGKLDIDDEETLSLVRKALGTEDGVFYADEKAANHIIDKLQRNGIRFGTRRGIR